MANIGNGLAAYYNKPGTVTFNVVNTGLKGWRTTNDNSPPTFTKLKLPGAPGAFPLVANKSNIAAVQLNNSKGRLYFQDASNNIGVWEYNMNGATLTQAAQYIAFKGAEHDIFPSTSLAAIAVPEGDLTTHYLFWQAKSHNIYYSVQDAISKKWAPPQPLATLGVPTTITAAFVQDSPSIWVRTAEDNFQCFRQSQGSTSFLAYMSFDASADVTTTNQGKFGVCALPTDDTMALVLQRGLADPSSPQKLAYYNFVNGTWTTAEMPSTQPVPASYLAIVGAPGSTVSVFYQTPPSEVCAKMKSVNGEWSDAVTLPA